MNKLTVEILSIKNNNDEKDKVIKSARKYILDLILNKDLKNTQLNEFDNYLIMRN